MGCCSDLYQYGQEWNSVLLFCVAAQYKQSFSKANNAHRYVYVCINMCMCVNLSVCLCVCVCVCVCTHESWMLISRAIPVAYPKL